MGLILNPYAHAVTSGGAALSATILALNPFAYYKMTGADDEEIGGYDFDTSSLTSWGAALLSGDANSLDLAPTGHPTPAAYKRAEMTSGTRGVDLQAAFAGTNVPSSFVCVVRADTLPGPFHTCMHVGDYATNGRHGWYFGVGPDGRLQIGGRFSGAFVSQDSTTGISTGSTYLIGYRRNSSGVATMYANGADVGGGSGTAGEMVLDTGGEYLVAGAIQGGTGGGVPAYGFDGRISHWALFDSDIGATAMADLFDASGL